MTALRHLIVTALLAVGGMAPAAAEWRAVNAQATEAARNPRIAAVLDAVNRIDNALIVDNHAAFKASLANELAVNNPQNRIAVGGMTAERAAAGKISYSRYQRLIEYAGLHGDMVVLMGEEHVVPKGDNPAAGSEVRRRFTDVWREADGRWLLSARQATIIGAGGGGR